MKFNKKGVGTALSDIPSIIYTFIILLFYFVFIILGSFTTGEVKSVIEAEDKVSSYNYYPTLINFLNTNTSDNELMVDVIKNHLENGGNNDVINENAQELFDKLSFCYYENGNVRKVGFVLFLSNGDKWDSIPFYEQWEVINFGSLSNNIIIPSHLLKPAAYQQIGGNDYVYLYREEGVRADKEECDNLA